MDLFYQVVRTYEQLLQRAGSNRLLEKFLNWYVPRLDALSFPLRRANEYEADAVSAEIVGRQRAAQALVNVHVRGAEQEPFWTSIKRQVHDTPHPPASLFVNWAERVSNIGAADMQSALAAARTEETSLSDTHPSLSDRLAALGSEPGVEPAPAVSAAQELFGEQYGYYVEQAGWLWSSQIHTGWQSEHQRLMQARERLERLEQERRQRTLSADEAFEYSETFEEVFPERDALPLHQAVLELHPNHLGARFAVARLLLARDDESGVPLMQALEKERHVQLRMAAHALLSGYYARRGEQQSAARSIEHAQRAYSELQARARARNELCATDRFAPHALSDPALAQLREDLALFSIKRAYLVQKAVVEDEPPLYVLAVEPAALEALSADSQDLTNRIVRTVTLPGETWVISLHDNKAFKKPLGAVEGSLVYSR